VTIGYYLRHQETVEAYLKDREQLGVQPDLSLIRSRLLAQQSSRYSRIQESRVRSQE
jgi:hypothetical protein